jgi:hypothetical protein
LQYWCAPQSVSSVAAVHSHVPSPHGSSLHEIVAITRTESASFLIAAIVPAAGVPGRSRVLTSTV